MSVNPPKLSESALFGLPGDIVRAILPNSEADPAALLVQTLVFFGNCIGRTAHFVAEDDKHHLNLFALMVGETSKGRKGTSLGRVNRIFRDVDNRWVKTRILKGLSSGEGLIFAVGDADGLSVTVEGNEPDKRLLVIESEFSSVLRVMDRHGNTLSAVIREAWDSGNLNVLTRTNPLTATNAHISIIGHITGDELRRRLNGVDMANGFANRFLFCATRRRQLLPEGGSLDDRTCGELAERLRQTVAFAQSVGEMKRDEDARTLWAEVYEELSVGHSGLFGTVTSRAEAQVMRLACVYALMDGSTVIRRVHLEAACALWQYCESSARYIFGDASGDHVADKILQALKPVGDKGLTQTNINKLFSGHKHSGEINAALLSLSKQGLATSREENTDGRPVQLWFATVSAEKAEEAKDCSGQVYSAYSASSATKDAEPEKEPLDEMTPETIVRAMNEPALH